MKVIIRVAKHLITAFVLTCAVLGVAQPAYAQDEVPAFVNVKPGSYANLTKALTSREKKAYKRALQACMDYRKHPSTIEVDISDLKLTNTQALRVGYMLHSNGELFWVSTYNDDNFTKDKIILPCTYDDATITRMRAQLNKAVNKALSKVTSEMKPVMKILTLHDYLIDKIDYADHHKTAYDGLVLGQADCFGFAKTMDLVLRRAGFSTDMAFNFAGNHAWNLVKVSGKWYHIDLTWDNGFSNSYYWEDSRCRLYLLQSDARMQNDGYTTDGHGRWWSSHSSTSGTYDSKGEAFDNFRQEAATSALYTNGFKVDGLKYKLVGPSTAKLVNVVDAGKKSAKTLTVPATITYKKKTYGVTCIGSKALSTSKATTLALCTSRLTKANVKDSLVGSRVKYVRLKGAAISKKSAYAGYFSKANCGRAVKVQ